MLQILLKADVGPPEFVLVFVLLVCAAVVIGVILTRMAEFLVPRRIGHRVRRFFGREFRSLQTHDKTFPGYDLGSVNRALRSLFDERCIDVQSVGACQYVTSLREIVVADGNNGLAKLRPSQTTFERMPVDVNKDESFASNCLYFAVMNIDAGPQKMAVLLAYSKSGLDLGGEDMDSRSAPVSSISISIACLDRAIADLFFQELNDRRQTLSIYRGKTIDPEIGGGGIASIAFRRLQPVAASDLVLPESVLTLVDSSIVGFYRHEHTLRSLGVDIKRGVLFHSPPGTGKTSICLYLASLLKEFTVCFVSGRKLLYPRELCRMARYLQPTMLVFEDIDLIAQERELNGLATVLGELMNQIDGSEPTDRVLFIMNTNSMDRVEQALRNRPGRVDQIIHIPLPDLESRRRLLRLFGLKLNVAEADVDRVAAATEGATPALLNEVVKRAAVLALQRGILPQGLETTADDLLLAYEQIRHMRAEKPIGAQIL